MDAYETVHESLRSLRIDTVDAIIDNYPSNAKDRTFMEVLGHLLHEECAARKKRSVEVRMRYAGFPVKKGIEQFDFSFQPTIDRRVMDELMTLRFVHEREKVVFLGPPGVGKTHLSIALGVEAVKAGFIVYYITASRLIQKLKQEYSIGRLEFRLAQYGKFNLMIVDEMGYLPLAREDGHLFFQFVSHRYERASTVFTSNKTYSGWGEVLGDEVMASAVLDRILHHSTTVNIRGESYRLRERRKSGLPTVKAQKQVDVK
jgi:DNA replication protein DnaC